MSNGTNCESCVHYVYDEYYGYSFCEINLDEDEMVSFLQGSCDNCHYFRLDDEYAVVRKQN
ncbi:MAG: DUF6472 family protein [Acutalibacteraceae bacterium]